MQKFQFIKVYDRYQIHILSCLNVEGAADEKNSLLFAYKEHKPTYTGL